MTVSLAAAPAAAAVPPAASTGAPGASQNLFEHMAETAKGAPQGASPTQLGDSLMERLNGFIDRQRTFSQQADSLTRSSAPSASPATTAGAASQPAPVTVAQGQPTARVGDGQIDQIVHSLGRMFDYSIETQMVVRGATQISGSANTLIKGQ
jgi:hypothetical protein